jgi:hypothetical protein
VTSNALPPAHQRRVLRAARWALVLAAAVVLVAPVANAVPGPDAPRMLVVEMQNERVLKAAEVTTLTDLLVTYLSRSPTFVVLGKRDLIALADLAAERQLLDCKSESCLAEIGDAMGARYVVFPRLSKLGKTMMIHLTLFDVERGVPVAREVAEATAVDEFPTPLSAAVKNLLLAASGAARKEAGARPPPPAPKEATPRSARPAAKDAADSRLARVEHTDTRDAAARVAERKQRAGELRAEADTLVRGGGVSLALGGALCVGCCGFGLLRLTTPSDPLGARIADPTAPLAVGFGAGAGVVGAALGGSLLYQAGELENEANTIDPGGMRY